MSIGEKSAYRVTTGRNACLKISYNAAHTPQGINPLFYHTFLKDCKYQIDKLLKQEKYLDSLKRLC